jgi:hypothetical protein
MSFFVLPFLVLSRRALDYLLLDFIVETKHAIYLYILDADRQKDKMQKTKYKYKKKEQKSEGANDVKEIKANTNRSIK